MLLTLIWFQASVLNSFGLFGEVKGGKGPNRSVVEAGPSWRLYFRENVLWRRTNKFNLFSCFSLFSSSPFILPDQVGPPRL